MTIIAQYDMIMKLFVYVKWCAEQHELRSIQVHPRTLELELNPDSILFPI